MPGPGSIVCRSAFIYAGGLHLLDLLGQAASTVDGPARGIAAVFGGELLSALLRCSASNCISTGTPSHSSALVVIRQPEPTIKSTMCTAVTHGLIHGSVPRGITRHGSRLARFRVIHDCAPAVRPSGLRSCRARRSITRNIQGLGRHTTCSASIDASCALAECQRRPAKQCASECKLSHALGPFTLSPL